MTQYINHLILPVQHMDEMSSKLWPVQHISPERGRQAGRQGKVALVPEAWEKRTFTGTGQDLIINHLSTHTWCNMMQ